MELKLNVRERKLLAVALRQHGRRWSPVWHIGSVVGAGIGCAVIVGAEAMGGQASSTLETLGVVLIIFGAMLAQTVYMRFRDDALSLVRSLADERGVTTPDD